MGLFMLMVDGYFSFDGWRERLDALVAEKIYWTRKNDGGGLGGCDYSKERETRRMMLFSYVHCLCSFIVPAASHIIHTHT